MGEGENLIHSSLILPFPPHSQHGSIKVGSDDFSNFKENPYTSSSSKSHQCSLLWDEDICSPLRSSPLLIPSLRQHGLSSCGDED